ncbi:MAG TPA: LytS/YhcK type 5TM receptor domain-containing protein [Candidatus Nitrosotalea sp.]|nr:LytS/YhcK type 5TM receptor domain-containing protein [Candidatus Nitrosotalea sp.]
MDYHHLLEAAGIGVSGVLFYSLAYGWFEPDDPRYRSIWAVVLGLVWGGVAVVLMISRIQTAEGVFVDGRVIPVAIIGLFEGWWAGLIAALAAAAYRVWLGGSGAAAGVVTVIAVAAAAGLAHRWAGGTARVRIHHAFVLAVATFFITFGGFARRAGPQDVRGGLAVLPGDDRDRPPDPGDAHGEHRRPARAGPGA